jgi:hypothetical protein
VTEKEKALEIIQRELALHPFLDAVDLEKLLYQAVFGGDHLLWDRPRFEQGLRREWEELALSPGPIVEPPLQVIDPAGRTARLHLRPCTLLGLKLEALSSFLSSQPLKRGSQERLAGLRSLARELALEGEIPLSLVNPRRAPFPESAPHHSFHYGPAAYRLIHDLTLPATATWIREHLP